MPQENFISVQNVSKFFGKNCVLDDVSLEIEAGTVTGLVGRNGSGKTMLLKSICGMVPVTKGKILCKGKEIGKEIEMPDHLGALIEAPGFLEEYNALQNLEFLSMLSDKKTKEELSSLLNRVGLDPNNKLRVGKYSMGMKQRLGIAQAIMDDPELLILDEPMNGLDIHGVKEMRTLFQEMKDAGTTILIASHIAEDIQVLCDQVMYMDQGKMRDHPFE